MKRIYLLFLIASFFFVTKAQEYEIYEDFEGISLYDWSYFENDFARGTVEFNIDNPSQSGINTSQKVAKLTKTATSSPVMNAFIDLPAGMNLKENSKFKLLVYSSELHQVKLKLQPGDDFNKAVERTASITQTNTWQELEFDFTTAKNRTDFTKINIHFNDNKQAAGTYYFDLLQGPKQNISLSMLSDGEIKRGQEDGKIITVNVHFDKFVVSLNPANWTFSNLPQGVQVDQINRVDDETVQLVLAGNTTEMYSSNITDFTVTIDNAEFENITTGKVSIDRGIIFDISNYVLVWSDEFDTDGPVDNTKWNHQVWRAGTVNNEKQAYTNRIDNSWVEDGKLIIRALKENHNGAQYTSARLTSDRKGDILYGRVEVRAKLPKGRGTWPAIWMMPTKSVYGGWPRSGEIDIMEFVGFDPNNVHANVHTQAYNHNIGTNKGGSKHQPDLTDEFNVFAINWTPEKIEFFCNDDNYFTFYNEYKTSAEWPFDKEFHVILNIAIGGDWGGAQGIDNNIFPTQMEVDYVRMYKDLSNFGIDGKQEVEHYEKNITYATHNLENATYTWNVPSGATIISGQNTNEIKVDWGCNPGEVECMITFEGQTYPNTIEVSVKEVAIEGKEWIDDNAQGVTYSVPEIENATYSWSASDGITITSGATSHSIVANFDNEGVINVTISTECGDIDDSIEVFFGTGLFPYPNKDKPAVVPGTIIAGHYDYGGEGVAYHDKEPANQGALQGTVIRPEEGVDTEKNDGVDAIGWIDSGEWLKYTVEVAETANYNIKVRTSGEGSGGKFRILFDDIDKTGEIAATHSGSWTNFRDVVIRDIELEAGMQTMKFDIVRGGFNMSKIIFENSVGINNKNADNGVNFYPNPANNFIEVSVRNDHINKPAYIYGLLGELYITQTIENNIFTIDLSSLKEGIYILSINNETHNIIIK